MSSRVQSLKQNLQVLSRLRLIVYSRSLNQITRLSSFTHRDVLSAGVAVMNRDLSYQKLLDRSIYPVRRGADLSLRKLTVGNLCDEGHIFSGESLALIFSGRRLFGYTRFFITWVKKASEFRCCFFAGNWQAGRLVTYLPVDLTLDQQLVGCDCFLQLDGDKKLNHPGVLL